MTITEARQFQEMLLRVKSLELELESLREKVDLTYLKADFSENRLDEILIDLPVKRGPGRPRKSQLDEGHRLIGDSMPKVGDPGYPAYLEACIKYKSKNGN